MAAEFSFFNGASRVILINGGDGKWRLDFIQKILPKLEIIEYTDLPKGQTVTSILKKIYNGRGPDVAIKCATKTDTPELVNEIITSIRGFRRYSITGVYTSYKDLLNYIQQEKIYPLHIVTHRFKLKDIETVYDLFNKRDPGIQKVFIQTKFSAPPAPRAPALSEL
ncbi:hypothetical protein N7504_009398 [Penicillium tannophilum]|nr:hypothetical protein N7504_009398 [Penicillium tannophilum]